MSHMIELLHNYLFEGSAILVRIKLDVVYEILIMLDSVTLALGEVKRSSMDVISFLS